MEELITIHEYLRVFRNLGPHEKKNAKRITFIPSSTHSQSAVSLVYGSWLYSQTFSCVAESRKNEIFELEIWRLKVLWFYSIWFEALILFFFFKYPMARANPIWPKKKKKQKPRFTKENARKHCIFAKFFEWGWHPMILFIIDDSSNELQTKKITNWEEW